MRGAQRASGRTGREAQAAGAGARATPRGLRSVLSALLRVGVLFVIAKQHPTTPTRIPICMFLLVYRCRPGRASSTRRSRARVATRMPAASTFGAHRPSWRRRGLRARSSARRSPSATHRRSSRSKSAIGRTRRASRSSSNASQSSLTQSASTRSSGTHTKRMTPFANTLQTSTCMSVDNRNTSTVQYVLSNVLVHVQVEVLMLFTCAGVQIRSVSLGSRRARRSSSRRTLSCCAPQSAGSPAAALGRAAAAAQSSSRSTRVCSRTAASCSACATLSNAPSSNSRSPSPEKPSPFRLRRSHPLSPLLTFADWRQHLL